MSDEQASAQRLKLVEAANRGLSQAWARAFLRKPSLDPNCLVAKAERREAMRLGPGDWREGLDILTRDLRDLAALNPLGRSMAHGQLVSILRQRMRAQRLWQRRPEILAQPIDRPLIILGQMRSGTTLMHRLLACDPRFAFTRLHETLYPLARSRVPGRLQAGLVAALLDALNPNLKAAHPTAVDAAEEEFGLHAFSLHGAMFEAQWNVPSFARWSEERDLTPVYREFRQVLQTLRWRRGDPPAAVQLLKAPQFMQDLPSLLDAFPGARIVFLRRDLIEVMASTASLVWNQRRIQSDEADAAAIGAEWRRKIILREERAQAPLSRLPPSHLMAVDFGRLTQDWEREIGRVYRWLGLVLGPGVREKMRRVAAGSGHRGHLYAPEQFGLDC